MNADWQHIHQPSHPNNSNHVQGKPETNYLKHTWHNVSFNGVYMRERNKETNFKDESRKTRTTRQSRWISWTKINFINWCAFITWQAHKRRNRNEKLTHGDKNGESETKNLEEGLEILTEGADRPIVTLAKIRLPGCNRRWASVSSTLGTFTGKQSAVAPAWTREQFGRPVNRNWLSLGVVIYPLSFGPTWQERVRKHWDMGCRRERQGFWYKSSLVT